MHDDEEEDSEEDQLEDDDDDSSSDVCCAHKISATRPSKRTLRRQIVVDTGQGQVPLLTDIVFSLPLVLSTFPMLCLY